MLTNKAKFQLNHQIDKQINETQHEKQFIALKAIKKKIETTKEASIYFIKQQRNFLFINLFIDFNFHLSNLSYSLRCLILS